MDFETLQPVIVSMTVYLVLTKLVPAFFKKPMNVKIVDDYVNYLHRQQPDLVSGVLMVGIITFITNYLVYEVL